eukprot:scaffold74020_cov27-Tisochrysis_lutea.AAC.1
MHRLCLSVRVRIRAPACSLAITWHESTEVRAAVRIGIAHTAPAFAPGTGDAWTIASRRALITPLAI